MKSIRRSGDSLGARKLHGIHGAGKHVFQQRFLVWSELAEDVADHFTGLAAAYAELESGEFVGTKVLEDGLDAVVTAGGALFTKPQGTERQGDVVINDEHLGGRPFVK